MSGYLTRRPKGLKEQFNAELRTIGDRYSKSGPPAVPVMKQEITKVSEAYVERGLREAYAGKKVKVALKSYTGRTGNNEENLESHINDLKNVYEGRTAAGPIHAGKGIETVPDMIKRVNDILEEAEGVTGEKDIKDIEAIGNKAVYSAMENSAHSITGINRTSKATPQEVVEGLEMGAAYLTSNSSDMVKGDTYQNTARIALELAKNLKISNRNTTDIHSAIGAAEKFEEEYRILNLGKTQSPTAQKIVAFKRTL